MKKFFVNVNTGELFCTNIEEKYPSSFQFPIYNVNGWTEVDLYLYTIMQHVYNHGWVAGVQDEIITNGE